MTTVDFCPPSVALQPALAPAAAADFTCAACSESFSSAVEQRAHCKSERHVYNTKRRLNGLKPISQEAWERKLREARAGTEQSKGTSHLKAKKASRKESSDTVGDGGQSQSTEVTLVATGAAKEEEWTPECSLFDRRRFESLDECLAHMWRAYDFSVPDREYCTDVPGLLSFLRQKISEPPHACIFCNRPFPDEGGVRRHMLDKNHTRIGTEARSRRGNINAAGSEELRNELEEFYDYHGSTREITERIKDPRQKVGAVLRYFDADRDGYLNQQELAQVWAATTGLELTEAQYLGACGKAGAEPGQGLDEAALHALYRQGLADLDADFAVLQDLLTQKLKHKGSSENEEKEGDAKEKEAEDEDDDEDEEGEEEEDDDISSCGTEIVECDDEDEFAEVMRILGLQPATLNESGDLRLPSGGVAAHRDVAYIWRQRGQRLGQLALSGAKKGRTPLMLSNKAAGTGQLALTKRQEAVQGKRIIAVLRQQHKSELRLGLQQNILQTRKGLKVRTAYGDASGGR